MSLNDEKLTIQDLKATNSLFQYSENDLKEILKSHGKTPKSLLEDVKIITDWLKTQLHFPQHPTPRQIASFLVNNKCSIEKTKQKIDMSFTIRSLIPDFYQEIYPKSKRVENCFKYINVVCCPKLSKDFNRVIIIRFNPGNEVLDAETLIGICLMFIEIMTLIDFVDGYEYISDLTNLTFTLGVKYTPIILKKSMKVLELVYSGRLKGLRIINLPKVLEFIIDIAKSVFKEKLQKRMEFMQGYDKLIEIYGKEFLPNEFGGTAGPILKMQVEYRKLMDSYNDYFETMQKMKIDESLRPEKLENDEFLGYYGNFKKIDID